MRAWLDLRRLRPADLYDAWLFAAAEATLSLSRWRHAPHREKGDAYAAYVAALDREAHAAEVLARQLRGRSWSLRPGVQLPS